jgi:hypothetical protein
LATFLAQRKAEADILMLNHAFIATADYQALLYTTDYSYVVGRRGTGKSAIYQQLKKIFSVDNNKILITEELQDYEMLGSQEILNSISSDYPLLRPLSRLLWTIHFLIKSLTAISKHYLFNKTEHVGLLNADIRNHGSYCSGNGILNCVSLLKNVLSVMRKPEEISRIIVEKYQIGSITDALKDTLELMGAQVIALYDRLDEAWIPEVASVSILGGLARTVAEYREKRFPLYPVLFIRDNMFRALAQFDNDFTRHIEGHTLRLQWDEESLFHLIAARLRAALKLESVESEVKVWNRFAQR